MKKLISSLILAAMLTAVVAAEAVFTVGCAEKVDSPDSSDTTAAAATETETETELSDNLPANDYDGYTFTFYTRNCCVSHVAGLYSSELSGDVINDAVYQRNSNVEDRFNVTIEEPLTGADGEATELRNAIAAGDDIADATVWHFRHLGDVALLGYLRDMRELSYIDFSRPWWSEDIINEYTIFDKSYVALGYYDIDNITFTGCMYFNKQIAENFVKTDLYGVVNDGNWTLDSLTEFSRMVGSDIDGDGAISIDNDQFGFGTAAGLMFMFQSAADQPTTTRDEEGIPTLAINTDRMVDIVNKCYTLLHEYDYSYVSEGGVLETAFIDGRVFIHTGLLDSATRAKLREMTDDFGILPFPKFDETQESYHSHGSAHGALIGVPITIEDAERTGILVEALTFEGYKTIRPAVYDVALKNKLTRDEDSAAMIDIILDGRTGDFADIYDEWGLVYTLDHMVGRKKDNNFASFYASNSAVSEKRIGAAVEKFLEME